MGKGVQGRKLRRPWLLLEELVQGPAWPRAVSPSTGQWACQASSDHHRGRLGLPMYPVAIVSGVSRASIPCRTLVLVGGPLPLPPPPPPPRTGSQMVHSGSVFPTSAIAFLPWWFWWNILGTTLHLHDFAISKSLLLLFTYFLLS